MDRLLGYLYVFPLIAWGAWQRIRHHGETEIEWLERKHPRLVVQDWTDGT